MMSSTKDSQRVIIHYLRGMAKVGMMGFGGGNALIPLLQRELVSPLALTDREFVEDTVIANITPGALPVKMAALAGVRLSRPFLAVLGAFVISAPGVVLTIVMMAAFSKLGSQAIAVVEGASIGVTAFIIYLLAHYIVTVLAPGRGMPVAPVIIAGITFLATGAERTIRLVCTIIGVDDVVISLPQVSTLESVLAALIIIVLWTIWTSIFRPAPTRTDNAGNLVKPRHTLIAVTIFAVLVGIGFLVCAILNGSLSFQALLASSALTSFGGGEAYVAVADGFFVSSGIVNSDVFYRQILPVANALPGPILVKIAVAMAFVYGGSIGPYYAWIFALTALIIIVGACGTIVVLVLAGWNRFRHSHLARNISAVMPPVICGLLISTAMSMMESNLSIVGSHGGLVMGGTVILACLVPLTRRFIHLPDIAFILVYALLTTAITLTV